VNHLARRVSARRAFFRQVTEMAVQDFDFLTLADVAALLHCSKAHVCKAVAGRVSGCPPIPAVSLGRRKLVRRETLLPWIEANEKAASGGTIQSSPERGRKSA
jgi:hypothetical protein